MSKTKKSHPLYTPFPNNLQNNSISFSFEKSQMHIKPTSDSKISLLMKQYVLSEVFSVADLGGPRDHDPPPGPDQQPKFLLENTFL